jgi:hypothetical protein
MTINVILNLLAALAWAVVCTTTQHASFSVRVFTGMGLGVVLGATLQAIYGPVRPSKTTGDYLDIVGSGYVKLLQMIVMPLIMVSIISAILKLKGINSLGKISALNIGTLMITTLIAASIGIVMAKAVQPERGRPDRLGGRHRARRLPARQGGSGAGDFAAEHAAELHSGQSLPRHDRRPQDVHHCGGDLLGVHRHRRHRHP